MTDDDDGISQLSANIPMSLLEPDVHYSSKTVRMEPAYALSESQAAKNG